MCDLQHSVKLLMSFVLRSILVVTLVLTPFPLQAVQIKAYIHREALLVYRSIHLLDPSPKELENFGLMLPKKNLKLIPDNMLNICSCSGKCDTNRCSCFAKKVKCTVFCHGRQENKSYVNEIQR